MSNEETEKKSHLSGSVKRFSLCMRSVFFFLVRPRPQWLAFSAAFFICCLYNSLHISIQADACALMKSFPLKRSHNEFLGEYIFCTKKKHPWPSTTADYWSQTCFYQITWKHSSEIYPETEIVTFFLHKYSLHTLLTDRRRCISQDSLL